jgi:hypothetical protein
MKNRRFSISIAFALSLFLVFIFVLSSLMKTSTPALAQTDTAILALTPNAPFKGKVVVINFARESNPNCRIPLEQVEVHKLGDRYFLTGKLSNDVPPFKKGEVSWVPLHSVTYLAEVDSVEGRDGSRASQKGATVTTPRQ